MAAPVHSEHKASQSRRSALLILLGLAVAPLAIQKISSSVAPLISGHQLLTPVSPPGKIGEIAFADGTGAPRSLADFAGRHVLLNVWATWCPPCKEEMPSLDRLRPILQKSTDIEVIALSVDLTNMDRVRSFYSWMGIENLGLYQGDESEVLPALRIQGLPTTLLLNHSGLMIARLIGPTVWDSPDIIKQLEGLSGDRAGTRFQTSEKDRLAP
jgi:thiol-disulfide isomerase/thioredoxin